MNKTISIYDLLKLIKNKKAPQKIKFCGNIYDFEDDWYLTKKDNYKVCLGGIKEDCNILFNAFNKNVEIIPIPEEVLELQQRIDKAIEYIENHSLYEEEYDYDYEENSYLSGIDDKVAKTDLLEILKGE